MKRNRSAGSAVYWGGKSSDDYTAERTTVMRKKMPAPRSLFGLSTLKVSETKSDLLRLIERAQLEILYRHPR
jgi:hypothetical protein